MLRPCPSCEASYGLAVEVERARNEVLASHGDEENHRSRGYVCAKSQVLHHLQRARERLRRRGKKWEEIGWQEAFQWSGNGVPNCASSTARTISRSMSATPPGTRSACSCTCKRSSACSTPSNLELSSNSSVLNGARITVTAASGARPRHLGLGPA